VWGPPNTADWHSRQYGLMYFWHGEEGSDMTFAQCRGRGKCKHLRLAWFDLDGTYHSCVLGIHLENDKCYAKRPDGNLQPVNEAANLAKRSRFEHGQRPPI